MFDTHLSPGTAGDTTTLIVGTCAHALVGDTYGVNDIALLTALT